MSETPQIIVVVPARLSSTRLENKLLLAESGKPLLAHTLLNCAKSKLTDKVVAAVDDQRLFDIATEYGFEAVMTSPDLASGTDRVWAAAQEYPDADIIINVQGDEAEIDAQHIDTLAEALLDGAATATLSAPLATEQINDPAAVKLVCDLNGDALYFSRSAIPFVRGEEYAPRLHVGVYGFQRENLRQFSELPPTPLEKCEKLEQLRLLENSIKMRVLNCEHAGIGIDTRHDYDMFLDRLAQSLPDHD